MKTHQKNTAEVGYQLLCISMTITLLCLRVLYPHRAGANDLTVSAGSIEGINTTDEYAFIEFDASWKNSWRTSSAPFNWDAIWVFAKYRVGSGPWNHASLHNTGHSVPSGVSITPGLIDTSIGFDENTNPAVGVLIFRNTDGTGTLSLSDIRVRWNYGVDGVSTSDTVDIKVFGVEMVFANEGTFFAGDNNGSRKVLQQGSSDTDPWYVSSENSISVSNAAGTGTGIGLTNAEYYVEGLSFTLPAKFPKGFAATYAMKYEISQKQYVEFFNTLDSTQKANRDLTASSGKNSDSLLKGNNISYSGGTADATIPSDLYADAACNFLSWDDVTAYLDWAGLRPMTGLEFEKLARGAGVLPVSTEYPWGTTTAVNVAAVSDAGLPTEASMTSNANTSTQNSLGRPHRVGLFADSTSTREQAGAGYYGIMDLGGNVYERAVTLSNSNGRAYTGVHGDGSLAADGRKNQSQWPDSNGAGFRGGILEFSIEYARTSDREDAAFNLSQRGSNWGGRGVRTAPSSSG